MTRTRAIDNNQDIIDSRDVIARINRLGGELEDRHNGELERATVEAETDDEPIEQVTADFEEWLKERHDEDDTDACELIALRALAEEGESLADWKHGEALIRETYFEDYARDLHEDINGSGATGWPYDYIDWERAAGALLTDYMSLDFDGVTYYARDCALTRRSES